LTTLWKVVKFDPIMAVMYQPGLCPSQDQAGFGKQSGLSPFMYLDYPKSTSLLLIKQINLFINPK